MSVSEQERERVFQEAWDKGNGFRFMFAIFSDIAVDPAANRAARLFIRKKISEIVKDPETARKLTPTDPYAKRPICNLDYYETFNRDNVTLVSTKENPIIEITPRGVLTDDGVEHELDVLVTATGFDAVDGNYHQMDIRGRGGRTIQQHWKDGPVSYLGIATAGLPNMFMVLGANSCFANLPPVIEAQVEFISDMISRAQRTGAVVEATEEAESYWTATCKQIADTTLFSKTESMDFRCQHPGEAPHRAVLHGWSCSLPADAGRCHAWRLRRLLPSPRPDPAFPAGWIGWVRSPTGCQAVDCAWDAARVPLPCGKGAQGGRRTSSHRRLV